ncbi:hypothetical protein K450DRAFT_252567 [Umbelopsis ramanniana AG]|uniref:FUN14 family-domain-containing protein n=1 Tax=Umbelopsis ramanniana AG TaxID=1314678 RepID=A0AAD5E808_UMBRA|nr:uncharacterized protein K450DRAFT_252567 [Umbelopsis ramanniana AG]KAI8577315.1 hypothetical protein K450DRAFT_252567 [Umbelopsis ramanniana AG]
MLRTAFRPLGTSILCRSSMSSVSVAPRAMPIAAISRRTITQKTTQLPKSWVLSKSVVPASSSTILAMVMAATATPLAMKKPVLCQAFASPVQEPFDPSTNVGNRDKGAAKSLLHTGELTFGGFLGVCTGYLIKKVGKLFALMVGVGFVFLQYCSSKGFVSVHWEAIENNWRGGLDADRDGRVSKADLKRKWGTFTGFLTHNLQFKSSFMVGFYAGIRYG